MPNADLKPIETAWFSTGKRDALRAAEFGLVAIGAEVDALPKDGRYSRSATKPTGQTTTVRAARA